MALVVPDGLDALGLVSRHGLVTGRGEPVKPQGPTPKASRVVEVTPASRDVGSRQGRRS